MVVEPVGKSALYDKCRPVFGTLFIVLGLQDPVKE